MSVVSLNIFREHARLFRFKTYNYVLALFCDITLSRLKKSKHHELTGFDLALANQ